MYFHQRNLRGAVFALAVILGAYVALLSLLSLQAMANGDDLVVGVALVAAAAWATRRFEGDGNSPSVGRRAVWITRGLPVSVRAAGAVAIVGLALIFDRYLDGDAEHFRLSSFVLPIMISCVVFDLTAGLVATAIGALAVDRFLVSAMGDIDVFGRSLGWDVACYAIVCAAISVAVSRFMDGSAGEAGLGQAEPFERRRDRPPF